MASREVERKEDSATKRLRELRVEIEEEKLRKIRIQNDQLLGRAVLIEDVVEFLKVATAKWDAALTLKLETEGPHKVDGDSAAERLVQLREIHDELREISANLFTWQPEV